MKVFSCSKCGAVVKPISLSDRFIFCDNCGVKIQNDEDKTSPKPFVPEFNLLENKGFSENLVSVMAVEDDREELGKRTKKILIILTIIFVLFLPFLLVKEFREKTKISENQKETSTTPNPSSDLPKPIFNPQSVPNISYRSSIEYDSSINAELVENPVISMEKLPTNEINELKKTVFAERKIHVYLVINEDGKVISAKAINGHPILRESSVEAAKKSVFSARKQKTTAIFTYIYIL